MNPLELFQFLKNLFRDEPEVIAAFIVGAFVMGAALFTFRRFFFPHRAADADLAKKDAEIARKDAELARKETQNVQLQKQLDDEEQQAATARKKHKRDAAQLQQAINQLELQSAQAKESHHDLAADAETHRQQLDSLRSEFDLYKRRATTVIMRHKKQLAQQTGHVREIEALQGRIWEAPPRTAVAPFRHLDANKAIIIAVTNLKGGVGKTSLTANLAATFWRRGKKVLAVDLDHQASLTNLCLPLDRIKDLRRGDGKFIENVFKARTDLARAAWNNLTHLNDDGSCLLAASEDLADVEEHAKAQWLINPDAFDMRYILRSALHDPLMQDRFDVILLDCPPRWTPASINALTACDCVLIPVLLDRTSAEAVPRLLHWLRALKLKKICPELSILGVVGNRAHRKANLTQRERGVWNELRTNCADTWKQPVHLFERFIPTSASFADAADARAFAADDENLNPIFDALVSEIEQRMVHDESRRVAAVS